MLDEKDITALELEKCSAKVRARETWDTICELKRLLKTYQKIHQHWTERFNSADRALAEVDGRLKKLPVRHEAPKPKVELTFEQMQQIAETLGFKLEEEEDD